MNRLTTAALVALIGLTLALPASADASNGKHRHSVSPMLEFLASGRVPGPDDFSALWRKPQGIATRIESSGLDAATPYTVWAVIFNHPEYCATTPCGEGDLPVVPGHDPRVRASVAYVTGGFSSNNGTIELTGRLDRARHGVKPTETLFGPGLLNGVKAEIHFVLRGHGQSFGDPLLAIGSYNGGCTEDNVCGDHQASVHVAR